MSQPTPASETKPVKEITGKHVLIGTCLAFGVIISVNVFMAVKAVGTFPGLEVKNSYVASQTFDVDKRAQLALGWHVEAVQKGDRLFLNIRDDAGLPVKLASLSGILGRPTSTVADQTPAFIFDGTSYVATTGLLAPGNWNFRMKATAQDGTAFQQRVVFYVSGA